MRVTESLSPAWEHMKRVLFRPFNLGTWFSFGFIFFLQSCAEGGGSSFNFPGGGATYFNQAVVTDSTGAATLALNPPGIGRNSFRGPQYFSVDMAAGKQFGFPRLGEATKLDLRFNFFNAFNMLNLAAIGFSDTGVNVANPNLGRSSRGLAGRVIEFQARLSF